MSTPQLEFKYRKLYADAPDLRRSYESPVGTDVAAFNLSEFGALRQIIIPPNCARAVGTGIQLIAPPGYFYAVCSRSGMALGNAPLFVANAPGIIDPDYRGELRVILYNGGVVPALIKSYDFIAQLILLPKVESKLILTTEGVKETLRGARGFGSSEKETDRDT